jgi:pimeloyl-ACP methyl ester carboxylesterase
VPAPPSRPLPGRLSLAEAFPAGRADLATRWLTLADGERVRAVVAEPPAPPDADAPVVLCLPGWGCSAYSFHRVLAPIAARGLRAAAVDLRGHGWSDKPLDVAAYTPAAFARWTAAVLDALGAARAVLVGHSLGGMIALESAFATPERVAGLVLVSPLGLSVVRRLGLLRRATPDVLAPILPRFATRAAVRVGLAAAYGPGRSPTTQDIEEYWAPTSDPALALATRLVVHADAWRPADPARLAAVRCPVHVLLGDRDNLLPVRAVRPRATAFPRGTFDVLPGVGHVPAEETPDRVVEAVARVAAAARGTAPPRG